MQTSYKKLWKLLVDLNMSKGDLRKATGLASGTMTKLRRSEDVSMDALKRICIVCNCNVSDIIDFIPEENDSSLVNLNWRNEEEPENSDDKVTAKSVFRTR